jgi:hypothetical protein
MLHEGIIPPKNISGVTPFAGNLVHSGGMFDRHLMFGTDPFQICDTPLSDPRANALPNLTRYQIHGGHLTCRRPSRKLKWAVLGGCSPHGDPPSSHANRDVLCVGVAQLLHWGYRLPAHTLRPSLAEHCFPRAGSVHCQLLLGPPPDDPGEAHGQQLLAMAVATVKPSATDSQNKPEPEHERHSGYVVTFGLFCAVAAPTADVSVRPATQPA